MTMSARPRVGLLADEASSGGGSAVSSLRIVRLLNAHLEMIPISFELSLREEDWAGRITQVDSAGRPAYRVTAADFFVDLVLVPELGERMLNAELRIQSWADKAVEIARREKLDAIHVYGAYGKRPILGTYIATMIEKPLILTFCGQDLERRVFGDAFIHLKQAAENATLITCKSEKAARVVRGLLRPSAEVRIIRNHVDEDYFEREVKIDAWTPGPVIGCFGEFRRVVGLDVLLHAYAQILETRQTTLALGGPITPSEAGYFNRQIEALPNNARVWRMGKLPHRHMLAAYRACDLIVAPSFADTSPYKVLEVLLAGVPLVATTAGGIPELVHNEVEALLVEPGDADALAHAIMRLLDDQELREKLVEGGRSRVRTQFNRQREQLEWKDAYRSIGLCT